MLTISGIDGLKRCVGQELGVSDWHEVTQERINAFAAATDDFEELHTSPERAKNTPWGVTIAHGLYTLSLGPKFLYELYEVTNLTLGLNYGFDRVRFITPVPVASRVRMRGRILSVEDVEGPPGGPAAGARVRTEQIFELDGQDKPACVAESLVMYYGP
jgi:acyl dehydratase